MMLMMRFLMVLVAVFTARIVAADTTTESAAPSSPELVKPLMVKIPAGSFTREDGRVVQVSAFSLSSTEVPSAIWNQVRAWGNAHGYELRSGSGDGMLSVGNVSWFDAVKWCNALSEMTGRKPVYYTDAGHQHVYRAGEVAVSNDDVDWQANGFCLPSEAQWEYACRAGTTTKYYWGNDASGDHGRDCCWHNNAETPDGQTHPVGQLKANAFGLHDMSGNVEEWCWDSYAPKYDDAQLRDPRGVNNGRWRVLRGGSVALDSDVSSAARHFTYPWYQVYDLGLRVASADPTATLPVDVYSNTKASISAAPDSGDSFDDAAIAQRLFAEIDLTKPELEEVRRFYEAKKYGAALEAYRDYFVAKWRKLNVQQSIGEVDPKNVAPLMALHPPLIWFDTAAGKTPLIDVRDALPLIGAWEKTHDAKYLNQWFAIWTDFAQRNKREFDALGPNDRLSTPHGFFVSWFWSEGYEPSERLHDLPKDLGTIVHLLPENKSAMPARPLAMLVTSLVTDHMAAVLKDPRTMISNQYFNSAYALVLMGHCFDEFKDAAAWEARGAAMMEDSLHRTVQADGGDMEESFNYNMGMVTKLASVETLLGDSKPSWLTPLHETAIKRIRMFAALEYPFGGVPGIGTNYVRHPGALWESAQQRTKWFAEERRLAETDPSDFFSLSDFHDALNQQVLDALSENGHTAAPPFTSVAFPYSGYYALRDGWRWDSRYLWFMTARPGSGHAVENINSVAIAAFGRHLLVDSGPESYGNPNFLPEDQRAYEKAIDRYADASFSHNTVIVDGQSQRRLIYGENFPDRRPYEKPIDVRWLNTADFDFTEGKYDEGYGNDVATDIRARHVRQIIFVRQAGLWIVLDRLSAKEPHTYTQLWNFSPFINDKDQANAGFTKEQVAVDAGQQRITTSDPAGPNVSLYQFNTEPLTYETFYGQLKPFLGWYNMGIVGRRYPKVDVHTNWKNESGESLLVTVIVPQRGEQSPVRSINARNDGDHGIRGFELVLTDGTQIAFSATPLARPLQVEDASAKATALLLVTRPGQATTGLVTDCSALTLRDKSVDAAARDFAFRSGGEAAAATTAMIHPKAFEWEKVGDSLAPSYR